MAALFQNVRPDPYGQILGTGFNRFTTPKPFYTDGLMKEVVGGIEVLAVYIEPTRRGQGRFKLFVDELKSRYRSIIFWHVINPDLEEALSHYGFVSTQRFEAGERLVGMIFQQ